MANDTMRDVPDLDVVKRGVLSCPACEYVETGNNPRPCPECTRRAEDGV